MRNLHKIIFLVLICISLYFIYKKVVKSSQSIVPVMTSLNPIQIENFNPAMNICALNPKLIDTNYVKNKKDYDIALQEGSLKYYLDGSQSDDSIKINTFYNIIEEEQPFHNNSIYSMDTEEIGDIRQSHHHIYVMNQARTMLMRGARNRLDRKKFINMLKPMHLYEDTDFNKIITAWGVSADEIAYYQYLCFFVEDLSTPSNSYFIFKKVSSKTMDSSVDSIPIFININNPPYQNTNDIFFVKPGDKKYYGSIYFKKNNELNKMNITDSNKQSQDIILYSLYSIDENNSINRIDIDMNKGEILNTQNIYGNAGSSPTIINQIPVGDIYKDLERYRELDIKDGFKFKELFDEVNKKIKDGEQTIKLYGNEFDNSYNAVEGSGETEKFNYKNSLFRDRYKVYKYLSKLLYYRGKLPKINNIVDIRVDFIKNKIFLLQNENNEIKSYYINGDLEDLTISNSPASGITEEIDYDRQSVPDIKSFDTMKEFILKSNKLLFNTAKTGFEIKNDNVNYNILSYLNQPYQENKKIQDLKKFYSTTNDLALYDVGQNVIGVIEFNKDNYDNEPSPKIKSFIKQPRNVLVTVYQEIKTTMKEKDDSDTVMFGRFNSIPISTTSSECIPAQKFNYNQKLVGDELSRKTLSTVISSPLNKLSLFHMFKKNMITDPNEVNQYKFSELEEWIHLYDLMRSEGLYNIGEQDKNYETLINSIENSKYFNNNADKWASKHKLLLRQNVSNLFEKDALRYFPNILIFDGEKLSTADEESGVEKKVFLHLKYNERDQYTEDMGKGDIVDEDFKFLKLSFDNNRLLDNEINYSETIDGKKYDYYMLENTKKNEVLILPTLKKNEYIWMKKRINNFEDFKNFVLEDVENEEDSRDRLRGIYEIPDMYVDDFYIKYLEESRTMLDKKQYLELIDKKKAIRDKYVLTLKGLDELGNETLVRKNLVGYPFIVFYKYIDYNGLPCELNVKNKQKIILSNRLLVSDIVLNPDDFSTRSSNLAKKTEIYPLVKQEFFSFSGNGTTIQYYEKKFGGITSIEPKKLCGEHESTFLDSCDKEPKEECQDTVLSFGSISGEPKCEIDDDSVIKKSLSPVEVLVPQAVSRNACKIYIVKGNIKIYFRLGKIFGYAKEKYQYKNMYTIKNDNDKYLYLSGNDIKEGDETMVVDDLGVVKDEFQFKAVTETDNYGKHFLFSPKKKITPNQEPTEFITAQYHPIQHTLGGKNVLDAIPKIKFILSGRQANDKRNYLNDEKYYSQKFNMNTSLLYNTAADDPDSEKGKALMRQKQIEESIAAQYFPEYAVGDKNFRVVMSSEEEQQATERLLNDVNAYLKKVTRINPVELPNLQSLPIVLKDIQEIIVARVPLIKERLRGLKYQVTFEDKFNIPSIYSNVAEQMAENNMLEGGENIISSNTNSMSAESINQMASALEAIKDFIPKKIRSAPQCKSLVEGFENPQYDENKMNNHMIDKYNQYITDRIGDTEKNLQQKKDSLFSKIKEASETVSALNMDSKNEQVKITQHLEDGMNMKERINYIRDGEQKSRMERMDKKLEEINKLRCQLGDLKQKTKVKDHPLYNSIISREDGTLLNVYKISDCDKLTPEDVKLNKNMIFVNGGCLEYDDKTEKLKVDHCMVNNKKQHFQVQEIDDIGDLQKFSIRNNLKPGEELESPHYIITQDKTKPMLAPSSSNNANKEKTLYSNDKCDFNYRKFNEYVSDVDESKCKKYEATNLCLDTRGGQLSMRDCNLVKPQQWDYSDITGPCK